MSTRAPVSSLMRCQGCSGVRSTTPWRRWVASRIAAAVTARAVGWGIPSILVVVEPGGRSNVLPEGLQAGSRSEASICERIEALDPADDLEVALELRLGTGGSHDHPVARASEVDERVRGGQVTGRFSQVDDLAHG